MDRVLPGVAGGLIGVGCTVAAYSLYRLWADTSRNHVCRPVPVDIGRYVTHPKAPAPQGWRLK